MATITGRQSRKVERLYRAEHSARQIAEQLGVSIDAIYYFLRRARIPRRTPTEQSQIVLKHKKSSYLIKKKLTSNGKQLFMAGVMLYWGEGAQWWRSEC